MTAAATGMEDAQEGAERYATLREAYESVMNSQAESP